MRSASLLHCAALSPFLDVSARDSKKDVISDPYNIFTPGIVDAFNQGRAVELLGQGMVYVSQFGSF
tara:strand:- start:773 stop:970 length:198 start_codon:yes stop_codon:yes gene_type:complete